MPFAEEDYPKYLAEFIGTYVLVLTIGCNVLGGTAVWAVVSIASALMVGIYALGGVSGAHFNPAVTLAITLSNKLKGGWSQAGVYMACQCIGGLLAAITYLAIFSSNFNLEPGRGHTLTQAAIAEILYTFMLCYVVLNVACSSASRENQYYGLAIGFVIVAGGYAVGSISGGAFNPAVALAIDLSSANKGFGVSLAYTAFEFIAAGLAAGAFRVTRPEEFDGTKQTQSAKLFSEFIGTYFLVVTVGFNVLAGTAAAAYSIAASLMCMIYAVGNVSGAHLNPAVTFAILLSGREKIPGGASEAATYVAAQLAGGLAAGATYALTLGKAFHVSPPAGWVAASAAEIIFTAYLCFVVLSVATTKAPSKDMFGLAIGSVITVAGFAVGSTSGAYLNPAVSIGADFADTIKGGHFGNGALYAVPQLVGSLCAAGAFMGTRPGEFASK